MFMACNLGTYGNLMYNLIVSSFLSNMVLYLLIIVRPSPFEHFEHDVISLN